MSMETHKTLTEALAAFQAHLPDVSKGSVNPAFHSRYADMADVARAVLPKLAAHGLSWVTCPTLTADGFVLHYELRHVSGESITGDFPLPDAASKSQALGSAITYARRYALSAVTGIAPDDDDDGNAAGQAQPRQRPSKAPAGWRGQVASAATVEALTGLYNRAGQDGWLSDEVMHALTARKTELAKTPEAAYEAQTAAEYDAAVDAGEATA